MVGSRVLRLVLTLIVGLAAVSVAAVPSFADECSPDDWCFPEGIACEDFALQVDFDPQRTVYREFFDRGGNLVRAFIGANDTATYTNLNTGATLTTRMNGTGIHRTFNPDGSVSEAGTGHLLLIFYPTDVPPGPWTRLYTGRVSFTIGADGVWTFGRSSGQALDICAALAD